MDFAKKHLLPVCKGLIGWGIFKSVSTLVSQLVLFLLQLYLSDASASETELISNVYVLYTTLSPAIEITIISLFLLLVSVYCFSFKTHLTRKVRMYPLSPGVACHSFCLGACLSVFVSLSLMLISFSQEASESYSQQMDKLTNHGFISIIISVLFIPLFEEILYRGILYRNFRSAMPRVIAMILASFVFGMDHGNIIQKVYAFILGILLAFLYDVTQSLLSPMLFHMAYNATSYILEAYFPDKMGTVAFIVLWQGAFVLAAAFLFFILWNSRKRKPSKLELQDRYDAGEFTSLLQPTEEENPDFSDEETKDISEEAPESPESFNPDNPDESSEKDDSDYIQDQSKEN